MNGTNYGKSMLWKSTIRIINIYIQLWNNVKIQEYIVYKGILLSKKSNMKKTVYGLLLFNYAPMCLCI